MVKRKAVRGKVKKSKSSSQLDGTPTEIEAPELSKSLSEEEQVENNLVEEEEIDCDVNEKEGDVFNNIADVSTQEDIPAVVEMEVAPESDAVKTAVLDVTAEDDAPRGGRGKARAKRTPRSRSRAQSFMESDDEVELEKAIAESIEMSQQGEEPVDVTSKNSDSTATCDEGVEIAQEDVEEPYTELISEPAVPKEDVNVQVDEDIDDEIKETAKRGSRAKGKRASQGKAQKEKTEQVVETEEVDEVVNTEAIGIKQDKWEEVSPEEAMDVEESAELPYTMPSSVMSGEVLLSECADASDNLESSVDISEPAEVVGYGSDGDVSGTTDEASVEAVIDVARDAYADVSSSFDVVDDEDVPKEWDAEEAVAKKGRKTKAKRTPRGKSKKQKLNESEVDEDVEVAKENEENVHVDEECNAPIEADVASTETLEDSSEVEVAEEVEQSEMESTQSTISEQQPESATVLTEQTHTEAVTEGSAVEDLDGWLDAWVEQERQRVSGEKVVEESVQNTDEPAVVTEITTEASAEDDHQKEAHTDNAPEHLVADFITKITKIGSRGTPKRKPAAKSRKKKAEEVSQEEEVTNDEDNDAVTNVVPSESVDLPNVKDDAPETDEWVEDCDRSHEANSSVVVENPTAAGVDMPAGETAMDVSIDSTVSEDSQENIDEVKRTTRPGRKPRKGGRKRKSSPAPVEAPVEELVEDEWVEPPPAPPPAPVIPVDEEWVEAAVEEPVETPDTPRTEELAATDGDEWEERSAEAPAVNEQGTAESEQQDSIGEVSEVPAASNAEDEIVEKAQPVLEDEEDDNSNVRGGRATRAARKPRPKGIRKRKGAAAPVEAESPIKMVCDGSNRTESAEPSVGNQVNTDAEMGGDVSVKELSDITEEATAAKVEQHAEYVQQTSSLDLNGTDNERTIAEKSDGDVTMENDDVEEGSEGNDDPYRASKKKGPPADWKCTSNFLEFAAQPKPDTPEAKEEDKEEDKAEETNDESKEAGVEISTDGANDESAEDSSKEWKVGGDVHNEVYIGNLQNYMNEESLRWDLGIPESAHIETRRQYGKRTFYMFVRFGTQEEMDTFLARPKESFTIDGVNIWVHKSVTQQKNEGIDPTYYGQTKQEVKQEPPPEPLLPDNISLCEGNPAINNYFPTDRHEQIKFINAWVRVPTDYQYIAVEKLDQETLESWLREHIPKTYQEEALDVDIFVPLILEWLKDPAVAFPDGIFACLKEIYGTEQAEDFTLKLWKFMTIVFTTPDELEDVPLPGQFSIEYMIPENKVEKIIGKGGETLESLQERAGCKILVIRDGKFAGQSEQPARIHGEEENCEIAKKLLVEIVEAEDEEVEEENEKGGELFSVYGFKSISAAEVTAAVAIERKRIEDEQRSIKLAEMAMRSQQGYGPRGPPPRGWSPRGRGGDDGGYRGMGWRGGNNQQAPKGGYYGRDGPRYNQQDGGWGDWQQQQQYGPQYDQQQQQQWQQYHQQQQQWYQYQQQQYQQQQQSAAAAWGMYQQGYTDPAATMAAWGYAAATCGDNKPATTVGPDNLPVVSETPTFPSDKPKVAPLSKPDSADKRQIGPTNKPQSPQRSQIRQRSPVAELMTVPVKKEAFVQGGRKTDSESQPPLPRKPPQRNESPVNRKRTAIDEKEEQMEKDVGKKSKSQEHTSMQEPEELRKKVKEVKKMPVPATTSTYARKPTAEPQPGHNRATGLTSAPDVQEPTSDVPAAAKVATVNAVKNDMPKTNAMQQLEAKASAKKVAESPAPKMEVTETKAADTKTADTKTAETKTAEATQEEKKADYTKQWEAYYAQYYAYHGIPVPKADS